ncbi:F-box protein MET30 [Frankliniella fusca]|uniref:F-box protein MET30 n=1 Tax=Frankliniella fusca TaxID=407009 RepID=A0AAE1HX25_9NEOP|nr:F-box protein MET30 [Frankliniella fusca]
MADVDLSDLLPDELWVCVFSFLDDAATLLDVVPLVCRRWCQLAGQSRSWANVSVKRNVDRLKGPDPVLRVLLNAPGLRRLELQCTGRTLDSGRVWPEDHKLVSALRRSRAVVLEELLLSGYFWLNLPKSGRRAVAEMVRRSAPFLRRVHVTLSEDDRNEREPLECDDDMTDDEVFALLDTLPDPVIPMVDAVLQVKRVEVLHLDMDIPDLNCDAYDEFIYKGDLSGIFLPKLRELVIKGRFGPVPTALISDLLGAAAPTLEVVKIGQTIEDWSADANLDLPGVVAALARCTRVRDLAADRHCLPALGSLPSLENLELHVKCSEKRVESAGFFSEAVAACEALASLRRLRLVLDGLDILEDDPDGRFVLRKCKKAFAGFSRRRPHVDASWRVLHEWDLWEQD